MPFDDSCAGAVRHGFGLAQPQPWPFTYWCVFGSGFDFTYIHGSVAECNRVVASLPAGTCLLKGGGQSRDAVRLWADVAAQAQRTLRIDVGRARAMAAADFKNGPA